MYRDDVQLKIHTFLNLTFLFVLHVALLRHIEGSTCGKCSVHFKDINLKRKEHLGDLDVNYRVVEPTEIK